MPIVQFVIKIYYYTGRLSIAEVRTNPCRWYHAYIVESIGHWPGHPILDNLIEKGSRHLIKIVTIKLVVLINAIS